MLQALGYISGVLVMWSYIPYVRDILQRTTKPQRASWSIWTLLGLIAFFAQLASGATNSLWITGVETFGSLVVFGLAIPYGIGGLQRDDIVALMVTVIGLAVWRFTDKALVGILTPIIICGAGSVLTTIKAYKNPESETLATWFLAGIAGTFATLAVGRLNYMLLAFPVYIVVCNFVVAGAIILGKRRQALVPVDGPKEPMHTQPSPISD